MSLHRVASLETLTVAQSLDAQLNPNVHSGQQDDHGQHHDGRVRRASDASLRVRKLSFNPLPQEWDPAPLRPDEQKSIGAFEVPSWKRQCTY